MVIIDGDSIQIIDMGFEVNGLLHPISYVNKVIVYGHKNLELWNVMTKYKVYDFSPSITEDILAVATSPKVDIIGISTSQGITLFNLKTGKDLFQLVQKEPSQSICFSDSGIPIVATGDSKGVLRIWSLHTKTIMGIIQAH